MGWFVSNSKVKPMVIECPELIVKDRLKKVIISGQSRMSDPAEYYEDLKIKLDSYFLNFGRTLIIDFKFDYINSGSSKWLYHILSHLQTHARNGIVEVNWYYEEDDEVLQEAGEVLQSVLQIPFHLKEI